MRVRRMAGVLLVLSMLLATPSARGGQASNPIVGIEHLGMLYLTDFWTVAMTRNGDTYVTVSCDTCAAWQLAGNAFGGTGPGQSGRGDGVALRSAVLHHEPRRLLPR